MARRPDARGPGRPCELDARSGSLDGRRVEDRCRCARCRGCFGHWLELRHAGRCVADWGICGFFGGFVVHPCSADRWRLGCVGVWFRVGLRGFRRLVAGGLGVCGKRFRVRLRFRLGRLRLRRFGRRVGRCGRFGRCKRLGLGLGKRRRLRFRTCACRPHGRAGGGGICCAGGPSGACERLCCALEQRRGRVQQRLHEHVAPPSPKRLQRVRGHRWANAHRLPAAARFEGVRRRVALAGAEGQPSASLHRAGSVFDRHLQCVGVELGIREPGGRG